MVDLHLKYVMFMMARKRIDEYHFKDMGLKNILELLTRIYALKELQVDNRNLYEEGFFTRGSVSLLTASYNELLRELRPHVIPLVELSDLSKEDSWNVSTIGNKYGDIYETQLDVAMKSRLNRTGGPPPYWEKYMKPLFNGGSCYTVETTKEANQQPKL